MLAEKTLMYDELYEAWKSERENPSDIKALPKDFFAKLAQYVKKLKEEGRMLDEKSTRARLLLQESKNARKLIEELFRLRYLKVMRKAMAGESIAKENLTEEEEELHKKMISSVESYQSFWKDVLSGRSAIIGAAEGRKKAKKHVLRFLREVPSIIGSDMKPYGPFKPEDVASLPSENAGILVKQGLAVEVEMNS